MQWDRLFHVLVVNGALLVAGCDEDDGDDAADPGEGSTAASADDAADDASTKGGTGAADDGADAPADGGGDGGGAGSAADATSPGDTGSATSGEDDDGASTGGHATSSADGEPPPGCSDPPNAVDPCGCPCCWAIDCVNTDESCCSGFTEACTPV